MADQLTFYRACQLAPTDRPPFRQRGVYLGEHDHAVRPGATWAECGAAAHDVVPLPFDAEVPGAFLRRPPRCPDCVAAIANG